MSLYEALERFVGTSLLACAGLVGAEMPARADLDGAVFARFLLERGGAEPFGTALDGLAHAIYFANERFGITQDAAERHASALAPLLSEVRLAPSGLATAIEDARRALSGGGQPAGTRLAEAWIDAARTSGAIARSQLNEAVVRFLLSEVLTLLVDQPRLLAALRHPLSEYRDVLTSQVVAPAPALSPAPIAKPPQAYAPAVEPAPVQSATMTGDLAERLGLSAPALRRFQAILAHQPLSAEHRTARLDELAGWLRSTVAVLMKPANDPPAIRQHKAAAAAALEAGELELAFAHLKSVRDEVRDGRRRAESRIAEELEALRRQMMEEAIATARLGELAFARMDLEAAANHFYDAAGSLPAREEALELDYRLRQADALAMKAELTGTARDLASAAQAFRQCRRLLTVDTDPRLRARIDVGLGDMLLALGEREADAGAALEEAVAVYAEAVAAIDRTVKPMQWALVQLSYAAALIALGGRRTADRGRFWRLAATALMPALEVFESRGAGDLAEAARAKLRMIATGLEQDAPARMIAGAVRKA